MQPIDRAPIHASKDLCRYRSFIVFVAASSYGYCWSYYISQIAAGYFHFCCLCCTLEKWQQLIFYDVLVDVRLSFAGCLLHFFCFIAGNFLTFAAGTALNFQRIVFDSVLGGCISDCSASYCSDLLQDVGCLCEELADMLMILYTSICLEEGFFTSKMQWWCILKLV